MRLRVQSQCHLQKTFENLKNENAKIETQSRGRRKKNLKIVALLREFEKNNDFYDRVITAIKQNAS